MFFHILAIDRLRNPHLSALYHELASRISHPHSLTLTELKSAATKSATPQQIREDEGNRLGAELPSNHRIVVLDERGKRMTSHQFADWLNDQQLYGHPHITFVIGGAFGLSPEVRKQADLLLQLSEMTLLHEWARVLLVEQLYRATTIWSGHPYHK